MVSYQQVSPLICTNKQIERASVRKKVQQNDRYHSTYDTDVIFYDVFQKDETIVLVGPPLLNFKDYLLNGSVAIDGKKINEKDMRWISSDRNDKILINLKSKRKINKITFENDLLVVPVTINIKHEVKLFKNKNVVFTLQKDNEIEWIIDWIRWYNSEHDIMDFLIFDNNSVKYTIEYLGEKLDKEFKGKINICIVPFHFKYGPQGGRFENILSEYSWDSDFCQYGTMEIARTKMLEGANIAINVDIDEFIVSDVKICDFMDEWNINLLKVPGIWVDNIPFLDLDMPRIYSFFTHNNVDNKSAGKWAQRVDSNVLSNKQWKVHTVEYSSEYYENINKFAMYHFKGINNSWKIDRSKITKFDYINNTINFDIIDRFANVYNLKYDISTYNDFEIKKIIASIILDYARKKEFINIHSFEIDNIVLNINEKNMIIKTGNNRKNMEILIDYDSNMRKVIIDELDLLEIYSKIIEELNESITIW